MAPAAFDPQYLACGRTPPSEPTLWSEAVVPRRAARFQIAGVNPTIRFSCVFARRLRLRLRRRLPGHQ